MRDKKIKFIDVGQGDCMLLQSESEISGEPLDTFIDAGNGSRDVSRSTEAECINIVLTHHHMDHVNGMRYLMQKRIGTVYLPFFANEIALIAKAVTSLKGFQYSSSADEVLRYFEDFFHCHKNVKEKIGSLPSNSKVVFLSEGDKADGGLECLNPPKKPSVLNWVAAVDRKTLFEEIDRLFVKHFADSLKTYFEKCSRTNLGKDSYNKAEPALDSPFDFWIPNPENQEVKRQSGLRLVLSFLIENLQLLSDFNAVPGLEKAEQIKDRFLEETHSVCVVLMAQLDNQKVLLTSDAGIDVFERLMRKGSIRADYMKAPHHGSKKNINREILEAGNPKAVIISHGNRRFGKSPDSHPNNETLKLLSEMKIQLITTQDIVKRDVVVVNKSGPKDFDEENPIIEID